MSRKFGSLGKVDGNAFERACEGKVPYPSEAAARAAMKFLQKEGALRTNDGMEVYECSFCREWHFGH